MFASPFHPFVAMFASSFHPFVANLLYLHLLAFVFACLLIIDLLIDLKYSHLVLIRYLPLISQQ